MRPGTLSRSAGVSSPVTADRRRPARGRDRMLLAGYPGPRRSRRSCWIDRGPRRAGRRRARRQSRLTRSRVFVRRRYSATGAARSGLGTIQVRRFIPRQRAGRPDKRSPACRIAERGRIASRETALHFEATRHVCLLCVTFLHLGFVPGSGPVNMSHAFWRDDRGNRNCR
jgi:hypothetical protein